MTWSGTRCTWGWCMRECRFYRSRLTRHDAPASVRQAYTPEEMRDLLDAEQMQPGWKFTRHYLFRMGVIAWKRATGQAKGRMLYDLIVIGGGPAGTSAAITAARVGRVSCCWSEDDFRAIKCAASLCLRNRSNLLGDLLDLEHAVLLQRRDRIPARPRLSRRPHAADRGRAHPPPASPGLIWMRRSGAPPGVRAWMLGSKPQFKALPAQAHSVSRLQLEISKRKRW